jgi:uncharacterized surface protein with fasciclin (FAS1) repeats
LNAETAPTTEKWGGTAAITIADVYQSNGVIHVIDTVVMPGTWKSEFGSRVN